MKLNFSPPRPSIVIDRIALDNRTFWLIFLDNIIKINVGANICQVRFARLVIVVITWEFLGVGSGMGLLKFFIVSVLHE